MATEAPHFAGCWRTPGHHDCAIRMIESTHTADVGARICRALGLDPMHVNALELRLAQAEVVVATVEIRPSKAQMGELMEVLEEYDAVLVPRPGQVIREAPASEEDEG